MVTVNLLSIDWDYFFNIHSDGERMECFQAICTEDYDVRDIFGMNRQIMLKDVY